MVTKDQTLKRQAFSHSWWPYALILPQIAIIAIFFIWPASEAVYTSFRLENAWTGVGQFVWFENYTRVFQSDTYRSAVVFTVIFSTLVAGLSMGIALLLAVKADSVIHGKGTYQVLLTWVYAIAPPVAGLLGTFLLIRDIGPLYNLITTFYADWDDNLNATHATIVVVMFSVWKQIGVNFVYFLAGLQSIPRSVKEAALMDNRSAGSRFWTVTLPLLAPTAFFVLVINLIYAFFETFGVIDTMTQGRPSGETATLVYRVYQDGFLGQDLGGSSAQSVILMILVLLMTVAQFRFMERKIHY